MDEAFLAAGRIALDLATGQPVADRWNDPSALPRMTVGMLACHLGRQFIRARELLPVEATGEPIDAAADHYRRAKWVTAESLDDPSMDVGRDRSEAELGFAAMSERCWSALTEVEAMLAERRAQDVVTIPWQGWSLRREDFLLTRLVEVVVHSDDLAHSLGTATPRFPDDAYRPVLHLLADLAAERHGQSALVSALTRRERMPSTISAF